MEYKRRFSQTRLAQERVSIRRKKTIKDTASVFLDDVLNERKEETKEEEVKQTSKCTISYISNYILFFIFTFMTAVYVYFAYFFPGEKSCVANVYSKAPVQPGSGTDVHDRFQTIFVVGSITGILELIRNSLTLWAKCFNHKKLAIGFTILGFITAYLFMLLFIIMILWRYNRDGVTCSGGHLSLKEKLEKKADPTSDYLITKGFVIDISIKIILSCFAFVVLGITCVAIFYK